MKSILFMRNRPARFNLGDYLCTPLHFFDFGVREYQIRPIFRRTVDAVILGGGAYNDLGVGQNVDFSKTVLWGAGSSWHGENAEPTKADNLPFLLYGVRDIDAVTDDRKFLPCVTCLHPNASAPIGEGTAIFLNFDKGITDFGRFKSSTALKKSNAEILSNNLTELDFLTAFSRKQRVVTNSFHVAYWSLLSGRPVAVIGYSTKFRSLFKMAGIDVKNLHHYDVADQSALELLVEKIIRDDDFVTAPNSKALKRDCIDRNIEFASECVRIGFVESYRLKEHTTDAMRARHLKYLPIQAFEYMRKSR